jgi:hypothetical protein
MKTRTTNNGFLFTYKPLDKSKREIRLIRLGPLESNLVDSHYPSIHYTIEHISLDNPPRYTGLSYT